MPRFRSIAALLFALLGALVVACDDSDGPIVPANTLAQRIAGDYVAQTDSLGGVTYWTRFGSDGTHVLLIERSNGIRRIARDEWAMIDADAGLIRVGGANRFATLSRNDSVLTLVGDDESDTQVHTRSEAMPNPETWVAEIQLLAEFDAPDAIPTDLSWDGTGLWFPGRVLNLPLQRMNPALNLQIDLSVPVSHSGNAVAYTPAGFWVDDWLERRLYQLYVETGDTRLATRFAAATEIRGLATLPDGAVCIASGSTIHILDMLTGDLDSVEIFQPVEGLESIGPAIYAALGPDGIARLEGPPWRAEATHVLPGFDVHGIAFDGADWWLYAIDKRAGSATRIVRAALDGAAARPRPL